MKKLILMSLLFCGCISHVEANTDRCIKFLHSFRNIEVYYDTCLNKCYSTVSTSAGVGITTFDALNAGQLARTAPVTLL